jgi:sugar lactone lactonase YvrE
MRLGKASKLRPRGGNKDGKRTMKRILQIFSNRMRLAALAAGLLCAAAIAPAALHAQSVYFAGTPQVYLGGGFNQPYGVAVDTSGNVYVVDTFDSAVKEIPASCIAGANNASCVRTLGGGFYYPFGVALDGSGDVFVADTNNSAVKEIPASCIAGANNASCVRTLGGGFYYPEGVAVDGSGDVFVAESGTPPFNDGAVDEIPASCIAGANNASCMRTLGGGFVGPDGLAVDRSGDVFVADGNNSAVYEIPANCIAGANNASCVLTIGGGFSIPQGVAVDAKGDLFVGDDHNTSVVEFQAQSVNFGSANICPAGQTTLAPCSQTITLNYNVTASGTLGTPQVLTSGTPNLDFTLAGGSTCTGSVTAGSTCTVNVTFAPRFAGARKGAVQILDAGGNVLATTLVYGVGAGPQIAFSPAALSMIGSNLNDPVSVAMDGAGNFFIGDTENSRVVKVTPSGVQTTVQASLYQPYGVAVDGAGDLFIADASNHRVVEVTPLDVQSTVPVTGLGTPTGIAVDGAGDLFIVDSVNNEVFEVTPGGAQTTVGNDLNHPHGVAVDGAGDVFIADSADNRVVKVTPGGVQTTVNASGLNSPAGVAVDAAGDVFIADFSNARVVEVTPGGVQTTLPASGILNGPYGVALDGAGDVLIADTLNDRILAVNSSNPPALAFATTPVGQTSSDSPQSVTIQNIGNASLSLTGLSVAANFGQVDGSGNPEDCTSSTSLAAGAECNLSLSFTPTTGGAIQGSAVLTDNALNGNPATQTIALSGTGTQASQTITFTGLPLTATYGAAGPYTLNGTASSGLPVSYNVSGPATITGNTLTITGPGAVIVIASQAGNSNYTPAVPVPQTIEVSAPAITVQYASTQLVYPGATNITACIASAHNITATGSVQIFDGTTRLATISVQGGGCAYWYISPGLSAGSHVLTAVYSGDKNNPAGPSVPTTINVAPVPVKLAPACWLTNTGYGANYQCTVSLSSNAGSAQGVMTYSYDGASPVSVPVNNGTANFTLNRPAAGNHSLVIAYAQQTNYAAAGPITENFTVSPAAVYVQLTPSSWYTSASAGISFTATVNSSSAGAPNNNGSVAFLDGNTLLANVPVNSSGQASYSTKTLAAGPHTITATYSGGTNYASGSSSVSITLTK